MEQHNRRLYRVARAVMKDDTEAEDVVQETYLSAFSNPWRCARITRDATGRFLTIYPTVKYSCNLSQL